MELLKGTPINCLAGSAPPPFPTGDLPFIKIDPAHPPEGIIFRDGVWPQVLVAKEKDAALAGATGGPWVDSNCHFVRLAQIKEPGKEIWLTYSPPGGKDIVPVEDYIRPVAEAGTYGARWVITIDEAFAQALEKRSEKALGVWRHMMAALTVVSNFEGETELMAAEFLNLAPRRHLAHRVVLTSAMGAASFEGQKAVMYLESAPPEGENREKLLQFAENGGTLFSPAGIVSTKPVETRQAHAIHTLGRGRVIVPLDKWEDPFGLARQVHLLLSIREDVVSVWNGGDMNSYYLAETEGKRAVVHLIPYASGNTPPVTIGLQKPYRTARVFTAGTTTQAKPVKRELGFEIPVGEISCYAAVELEL
jgi:hypothetical protein